MHFYKTILLTFMLTLSGILSWSQYGFDTLTIHFEIGEHELDENQTALLDSVILLARDEDRKMLIYGYADYLGTQTPNQALSDRRAAAVYGYLVSHGLEDSFVIQYTGAGQVNEKPDTGHGNIDYRKADLLLKRKQPDADYIHRYLSYDSPSDDIHQVLGKRDFKHYQGLADTEAGQTFVLKHIHFYMGRSTMVPASVPYLDELFDVLKAYPQLKIRLEGHVCCLDNNGDSYDADRNNNMLSVNRAEMIYRYLVDKGIEPSRLSFRGYGKRHPVHPVERTDQQALENRRVEVRILEK